MPNIDLSILNQRQTPAFYADVFANRPAAGFVGRIFVSTDTYAFYRDNGTSWDLIGGPGTGTVTGTGANGQVTFWNGASTITGSNDLFWDATNGHLGVNTNAPGTALDVHHDQSTVAILNQTVATNDVRIGFQNNGVGLWRIGAFYNAGANDFGIFDAVGNIQPVTVKKTTGQVLIGTSTVGSGKLVVASASSDNGIQIVGASAPSLRIDSAESGPTKRAGLGISTATNNFIQGSADRDFCIFNGSTAAASPILFGIYDAGAVNVQEAARISPSRNFLVGTSVDTGKKLYVNGTAQINGELTIDSGLLSLSGSAGSPPTSGVGLRYVSNRLIIYGGSADITFQKNNNTGSNMIILDSGNVGIGTTSPSYLLDVRGNNAVSQIKTTGTTGSTYSALLISSPAMTWNLINDDNGGGGKLRFYNDFLVADAINIMKGTNNVLIGTTTDNGYKLQVAGNAILSNSGAAIAMDGRGSGNSGAKVQLLGWAGVLNNWEISTALYTGGGLDLAVSTTGGGSTFTTAIGTFNQTTGVYTALSDINKKKNFETSNLGLEAVLKLKPTLYNMKSQNDNEPKELGFIAQEVKEAISQAYVENGSFIGINERAILATVVKAIQELNTKIENLK